jgi:hypothetical protein
MIWKLKSVTQEPTAGQSGEMGLTICSLMRSVQVVRQKFFYFLLFKTISWFPFLLNCCLQGKKYTFCISPNNLHKNTAAALMFNDDDNDDGPLDLLQTLFFFLIYSIFFLNTFYNFYFQ